MCIRLVEQISPDRQLFQRLLQLAQAQPFSLLQYLTDLNKAAPEDEPANDRAVMLRSTRLAKTTRPKT
mgnify:CR=1 FL=1